MFSQNERISTRQFKRLLTLELFGVTTVMLPGILCETVKRDGMTALFFGMIFVLLYGYLLKTIGKISGKSLQQTLKNKSRILYDIFLFILLIQLILMGIWVLTLASEMSRDILLQGTNVRFAILTLGAVSLVGAMKGMECRGRMAEVLYLFLLVPFVLLLALAAKKVNMDFLSPLLTEAPRKIVYGSYEVFIVFQGVTLSFFALPYLKNRRDFWKGIRKSVLLNVLFCLLLMGISIGIFGLNGVAGQKWLAVNLMTTPQLPGGLAERLDVLMVTIWIVSLYFFVSGSIFYGGKMAGRLLNMKHEKTGLLAVAVLIVLGGFVMGNRDYAYYVYLNYMKYIGVPLLGIILLLILWKLRPAKALRLTACLVILFCLTGCARGVELEDREFALSLGIDWSEDKVQFYYDTSDITADSGDGEGQNAVKLEVEEFSQLQSAYGQQSDKYLDCNHLKTIIIGKGLASNQQKMTELLEYIETNELFARNTKLFFAEESLDSLFELCGKMDTALGEYLENIYVDSNYYVEEQSTSLGDLINHRHDSEEILLVPVLNARNKKPVIVSYALVRKVQWTEGLEPGDADLIFLGNGVSIPADFSVGGKYTVKLEKTNREVTFSEKEGNPVAVVTIKLRGHVVNQTVTAQKEKNRIANVLEEQLESIYADKMQNWNKLDVLHLYRSLGSHSRTLWEQYEEKRTEFGQKLQLRIKIKASIV